MKSKAIVAMLGLVLAMSSNMAMANAVNCMSYSKYCSFAIHYKSPTENVELQVLDHAAAKNCNLSAGQTLTLTPTQGSPSSRFSLFEGHSKKNERYLILRLAPEAWTASEFESTLEISLPFDDSTYSGNTISCS